MSYHVTVAESAPETVLQLHRTIRADHAGDDIGNGMQSLYELAAHTGMHPAGPPSTTYHSDFLPGQTTEVDFCLPVAAGSNDGVEQMAVRSTESGIVARTIHHGDYHSITHAYRALDQWLRESPFRPVGPPTEIYLVAPEEAVAAKDLVTEIRIPVAPTDLSAEVASTVADTAAIVREALAEQGFGVLTEIDVSATLRDKIGRQIEDYFILGACNPTLASEALDVDRAVGLLLPCNVVVRATDSGTVVEAVDPRTLLQQSHSPALAAVARQARAGLAAAIAAVGVRSHSQRTPSEAQSSVDMKSRGGSQGPADQ
ncbi:DUF302 domain-containing protein [Nocardia cyriacigeorgica]|uniref:DUF302 domain-containing protein n=1 Tax=Nocardia cyriacigeorgica TaxID=135487 RepID=A0ABX0CHE7_9NOCA|nr:DUF302 domain-containing protein [Nocardia cyriacigeorgica]NEW55053.1 DUF302 domain-containing protein [Nocardia cyriacigeorgica]